MIKNLPDMVFPPSPPLENGGAAFNVTPGASPFTYRAQFRQALHITGGTVSVIQYARGPLNLALGLLTGGQLIELNTGDTVRITYLTAPSLTVIPR